MFVRIKIPKFNFINTTIRDPYYLLGIPKEAHLD